MKKYIGTKLIEAKEITLGEYNNLKGWTIPENEDPNTEGYIVKYSDDYISWSPKKVFEQSYLEVQDNTKLPSGVSVGQGMVDNFIKEMHISTIGEKTTMVRAVLVNDFEIIETSACVDKINYSEKIGAEICIEKIKDRIWHLLGFLLQSAYKGFK